MAVSAPTTPAHTERPMNLQSESLAWLDKAALNSDPKESLLDVSVDKPYRDIDADEANIVYKVVDDSKIEPNDSNQFADLNGQCSDIIYF